jgi:hypothetical protein
VEGENPHKKRMKNEKKGEMEQIRRKVGFCERKETTVESFS